MDLGAWAWALVSLGVLLVAVDRVVAAASARRARRGGGGTAPRRVFGGTGTTTGGPGFGDVVEIFQPTARYLHEEQERQRHDVVQTGDADPDWDLDLDRGTARVRPVEDRAAGSDGPDDRT